MLGQLSEAELRRKLQDAIERTVICCTWSFYEAMQMLGSDEEGASQPGFFRCIARRKEDAEYILQEAPLCRDPAAGDDCHGDEKG